MNKDTSMNIDFSKVYQINIELNYKNIELCILYAFDTIMSIEHLRRSV